MRKELTRLWQPVQYMAMQVSKALAIARMIPSYEILSWAEQLEPNALRDDFSTRQLPVTYVLHII